MVQCWLKPVLRLQLLHQLLRQRRQAVVPAVHQVEVQALAAEPLVVLGLAELLVVQEPAELLVVQELAELLVPRVLEQLEQRGVGGQRLRVITALTASPGLKQLGERFKAQPAEIVDRVVQLADELKASQKAHGRVTQCAVHTQEIVSGRRRQDLSACRGMRYNDTARNSQLRPRIWPEKFPS